MTGLTEPFSRYLRRILAAAVFLLPLVYCSTAVDAFRYPKLLLLRATAIVLLAFFATAALWGGFRRIGEAARDRRVEIVVALIGVWAIVTTAVSTNHLLSLSALEYTGEALLFFAAAWIAADGAQIEQLLIPAFAAGVLNALLAILQATALWNPFRFDPRTSAHIQTSAFLGNPNDVGAYLMLLSLAATAMAVARKQWRWRITAGVLIAGLVASQSFAALGGFALGVLIIAFLASRRVGFIAVGGALLAMLLAFAVLPPLRARIALISDAVGRGDWPVATSFRIFPVIAAWDMFADHPLTGAGPGTFKFHFLDYRMKYNERDPRWFYNSAQNFGEAHCDHVQILAEEGLPGWLLFAAALLLVGSASRRRPDVDADDDDVDEAAFVHYSGAALAAGFATLALASFPLEMAAVMVTMLYLSAVVLHRSRAA